MKHKGNLKRKIGKLIDRIPRSVTVNIQSVSRSDLFRDKTVLVIGGSRGIGFEIAKSARGNDANVIISGRNKETLSAAADCLGSNCRFIVHDNRDFNNIDYLFNTALSFFGRVDAVVYNSAINLQGHGFTEVTMDEYDKQFDTNLKAAYFILQKFIKEKKRNERLDIVVITSESGSFSDYMPYNLTKVALNSMIKGLAKKYYKNGIRINGVAPGVTLSDMKEHKESENINAKDYSPGRYFIPKELSEVVMFLLSQDSDCISGEIITCAGGHQVHTWE